MINQTVTLQRGKSFAIRPLTMFVLANVLCMPLLAEPAWTASGLDDGLNRSQFIARANELLEQSEQISLGESGGTTYLYRKALPAASNSTAVVLLLEEDAGLLEDNLPNSVREELGLIGWPVLLASLQAIEKDLQQDVRQAALLSIVKGAIGHLTENKVNDVVLVISGNNISLASDVASGGLPEVSYIVFADTKLNTTPDLPEDAVLKALSAGGVSVLDFVPGHVAKRQLLLRQRLVYGAGFEEKYRRAVLPGISGDALDTFFTKRLRHWLESMGMG